MHTFWPRLSMQWSHAMPRIRRLSGPDLRRARHILRDGTSQKLPLRRGPGTVSSKPDRSACRFHYYGAYLLGYLLFLAGLVFTWQIDAPNLTFDQRDQRLALWLAQLFLDWGGPLDVTVPNPFQGMVSVAIPVNPFWTPPLLPAVLMGDTDWSRTLVMVVNSVEVSATTFALLRCLRFRALHCLLSVFLLHFLLFPPFTFSFALHGWLQTGPYYGHTLALGNLLLLTVVLLGRLPQWPLPGIIRTGPLARHLTAWAALTLLALFLVLANLISVPFYAAGMLAGFAGLCAVLFCAAEGWRGRLAQLAAGLAVALALVLLGTAEFYETSKQISARFVDGGTGGLLALLNPPAQWSFDTEALTAFFCGHGIACSFGSFPVQPRVVLLASLWFQIAVAAGIGLAIWRWRGAARRFALWFGLYWAALAAFFVLRAFNVIGAFPLAPLYLYYPLHPFWAAFSLYAAWALAGAAWSQVAPRLHDRFRSNRFGSSRLEAAMRWPIGAPGRLPLTAGLAAAVATFAYGASLEPSHVWTPPPTPIVNYLTAEIALRPGDSFRGSVASILVQPEGPLRRVLGPAPDARVESGRIERYLNYLEKTTGSGHALLDLWWYGIPTFEEYGQAVTRQMGVIETLLTDGRYVEKIHFLMADIPDLPLLQALGVRFVISDLDPGGGATARTAIPLPEGGALTLYELPAPNLGGFSPTRITGGLSGPEILAALRAQPGRFDKHAYADGIDDRGLRPARGADMIFVPGGVRIRASSTGRSALLLPLQFSHCLQPQDRPPDVQLARANIAQTLLAFDRQVDIVLRWDFGLLGNAGCRARDVRDLMELGLL
ncbi:hypothetical protein ACFOGJ_08105 [Marinibaculum pumilum]|uniref:DUF2723 domain-containing protein n=1 Tax=Marinibaculum pumilum TaxID=1766165 RepID=A0ABV7KY03_9PROT